MAYAEKVFHLGARFATCRDARRRPQFETPDVVRAAFTAVLGQLGSLHALAPCRPRSWLRKFIGGPLPSDDTIGRVMDTLDVQALRDVLVAIYTRLRRNKVLRPLPSGFFLLVFDGHDGHYSRRRRWEGCQTRKVETITGPCLEYFPRYVAAQLVGADCSMVVDIEPLLPGDGELTAADRLLKRLLQRLPRAFDVVMGDALYASGPFWQTARRAGKHVLTVLKQEEREVLRDARALWATQPVPEAVSSGLGETVQYWDVSDLRTWPQAGEAVRLVRAQYAQRFKRQLDQREETIRSEWIWATTLPQAIFDASLVAQFGRSRWSIENNAFNELVTAWHADHLYRCSARAVEGFLLLTCAAQALFNTFYRGSLKPALRARLTARGVADIIRGELRATTLAPHDSS